MSTQAQPDPVHVDALASLNLEVEYVETRLLHPNDWNPNYENPRTYESVRESIRTFGFLDPIAVRAHPDLPGEFQILGGEHRWRAAQDEGIDLVPITRLDRNRPMTDLEAKKLTLALNTGGEPDLVPLAKLLADMGALLELPELQIGLPYDMAQLEELLKLGQVNWDEYSDSGLPAVDEQLRRRNENAFAVALVFNKAQRQKYDTFLEILKREIDKPDATDEEAVLHGLAAACKAL